MKRITATIVIILLGALLIIISRPENKIDNNKKLVVYTPHPTEFVKPLVEEYERRTGTNVEVIFGGTGELKEKLREGTDIDVMWGGSYYSVYQYSDLFADYWTPNERYYRDEVKNVEGNITRFTDMPSVIMVNTDLIGDIKLEGYEDLLNPELKGKIAFADPAKSSSSFEQLINMVYACKDITGEGSWDYIRALCDNLDGNLLESSSDVYNGVAQGKYIVGLTFEEAAQTLIQKGKHVKIIYMEEGVVSTPDGIYLLKNAKSTDEAKLFIDFLTGYDAQNLISQQLARRSVRKDIPQTKGLPQKSSIKIIYPSAVEILNNRESWIEEFGQIFEEEAQ